MEWIKLKISLMPLEKQKNQSAHEPVHCVTAQKPGADGKKVTRTSGDMAKWDKDGTITYGYCADVH